MRRLAPDFIEQVRLANDIVDIIGEDTLLKRSGSSSNYLGQCPFPNHKDKTPSFSVSQDQQVYHCFGCHASGNIYTYLQAKKGLHFIEAVQELAKRAGLSLPAIKNAPQNATQLNRKDFIKINTAACHFYHRALKALPAQHPVSQYLNQRGLSRKTIDEFQIGYADSSWDGLLNYLKKQGVSLNRALELGLIARKNEHFFNALRDRIIFPIFAINGKDVLGFGARGVREDQVPKYINSADSPIFHKGALFYGWHKSAAAIRTMEKVLVVEGYMDYLSLYQRGIQHSVATLGTALTLKHAQWLSRRTKEVVLCFDADSAGQMAAEKSLRVLLSCSLAPKILQFPDKKWDPDSFIQAKGASALQEKITQAPDLFLELLAKTLKPIPDMSSRLLQISKIAQLLVPITNPELKKYYITRVLNTFGTADKWAMQALNKAMKKERQFRRHQSAESEGAEPEPPTAPKISLATASKPELHILVLALNDFNCYLHIVKADILNKIQHPGVSQLLHTMMGTVKEKQKFFNTFIDEISDQVLEPHQLQKNSYEHLTGLSSPEQIKTYLQHCINKINQKYQLLLLKQAASDVHNIKKQSPDHLKHIINLAKQSRKKKEQPSL